MTLQQEVTVAVHGFIAAGVGLTDLLGAGSSGPCERADFEGRTSSECRCEPLHCRQMRHGRSTDARQRAQPQERHEPVRVHDDLSFALLSKVGASPGSRSPSSTRPATQLR